MSEMLSGVELEAADRTADSIKELRADSHRRLAAEAEDSRITKRRRKNVLRAYEKQRTAV